MDLSKIPTYRAGIAQSKAHRALQKLVTGLLKKHGLTMLQWFILGLVYDAGRKGIRISDLAVELDTTLPFVTNHINLLESRDLVSRDVSSEDSRARIVAIRPQAKKQVKKIEEELRIGMRKSIYSRLSPEELRVYIKVLNLLADADTVN